MEVYLVNDTTNLSLTCEADGAWFYTWERQNGVIPFDSIGMNTKTLILINLRSEDTGNYRCVVSNDSEIRESDYANITING